MQPSRLIYFEIHATAPETCMHFYQKVFGWQFKQLEDQPYWLIKTGPDELPGINGAITTTPTANPSVINTIQVQSLKETMAAIEAQGGQVLSSRRVKGIGQTICFKDPEGHMHRALEPDGLVK